MSPAGSPYSSSESPPPALALRAAHVAKGKEHDRGGERCPRLRLFRQAAAAEDDSTHVECLGLTSSRKRRRQYFLARLKEKLPGLRQRPDFPVENDEDILRLSDPPYYTAYPNPFPAKFVERHGRTYDPDGPYHRDPFAVDVSAGKTAPLYRAHGYHTKVPHLAIVPSILHYTQPGDVSTASAVRA